MLGSGIKEDIWNSISSILNLICKAAYSKFTYIHVLSNLRIPKSF